MTTVDFSLQSVRLLYIKMVGHAIQMGLPTGNMKIFMRSDLADSLHIGDNLQIEHGRLIGEVEVVRKDDISRKDHSTDVYIYDPNWNWKEEV